MVFLTALRCHNVPKVAILHTVAAALLYWLAVMVVLGAVAMVADRLLPELAVVPPPPVSVGR